MRRYCLALAIIAFLAVAQCQESNNIDINDDNIEWNLSINLTSIGTKCNETAQFCPGGNVISARLDSFKVDIENKNNEPITDVTLMVLLPKGMKYINYSYLEKGGGRLEERLDPTEFNETQNTSIKWSIGDMQVNEIKSMIFRTHLRCSANRTQIELNAQGYISNKFMNDTKEKSIILRECNCISESIICPEKSVSKDIDVFITVYESKNNTSAFFGNYSQPARLDRYNITVKNGVIPIDNVEVIAIMPEGMMFKNAAYSDPRRGRLNTDVFGGSRNTFLTWSIGSMLAREAKSIIFEAYLKKNVDNTNIRVDVFESASDEVPVNRSVNRAIIEECSYRMPDGNPCDGGPDIHGPECQIKCDDWINQKI